MEFQRDVFKVKHPTLTLTLLAVVVVVVGKVGGQSAFPRNYSDVREQLDALSRARYLLFPHIYRAFIDAGRSPSRYNVSNVCQGDLRRYYTALNQKKAWAWRRESDAPSLSLYIYIYIISVSVSPPLSVSLCLCLSLSPAPSHQGDLRRYYTALNQKEAWAWT